MIVAIIVGIITGVISSAFTWWLLHHVVSPKVVFSSTIKKQTSSVTSTGLYYQIKIGNARRISDAVDLKVQAVIYLPNYPSKDVMNIYPIPSKTEHLFELPPKPKGGEAWGQRISLIVTDPIFSDRFKTNLFPDNIARMAAERKLTLEDLYSLSDTAYLRIYVSATSSISGSKKTMKSKDYTLSDIKPGKFIPQKLELVEGDLINRAI